jgi:hypothetical protein
VSLRTDGATRGDLAEATALVVTGGALLLMPVVAVLDRVDPGWLWVAIAGAGAGLLIAGLGVRWFLVDGPPLQSLPAEQVAGLGAEVPLPAAVRLIEARERTRAHGLRLVAVVAGLLLMLVDLGFLRWLVVGAFFASFAADQILLRPLRWILDDRGLRRDGRIGRRALAWSDVRAVWWRAYGDGAAAPFPSGERVIVEREGGDDLEFVFHRRGLGTEARAFVSALAPLVGDKLRVLQARKPTPQP